MSSEPDGSDPRVLQPEGIEVIVSTASSQSKNDRYHKRECYNLNQDATTKVVDVSVAKWKGMEKCRDCYGESGSHTSTVDGATVDRIRRALVNTNVTCTAIASAYSVKYNTIRYHARGTRDYNYRTEPECPPVKHENGTWVWSE